MINKKIRFQSLGLLVTVLIFVLQITTFAIAAPSLNDGIYYINLKQSGKALNLYAATDGEADRNWTKVTVFEPTYDSTQRFRVENIGNGKCKIYAISSSNGYGRVVDLIRNGPYNSITDGAMADIFENNDPGAQEFLITQKGDGYYTIELASKPGYVLGCNDFNRNGGRVILQSYHYYASQHWSFTPVTLAPSPTPSPTFTPRWEEPDWANNGYYSAARKANPYWDKGNCVVYVWGRTYELTKQVPPDWMLHNAYTFWQSNINSGKYAYGSTPKLGAVVVFGPYGQNPFGHVAVIEAINGDTVTVSESGYGNFSFKIDTVQNISRYNGSPLGYIYILEPKW